MITLALDPANLGDREYGVGTVLTDPGNDAHDLAGALRPMVQVVIDIAVAQVFEQHARRRSPDLAGKPTAGLLPELCCCSLFYVRLVLKGECGGIDAES